MLAAIPTGLASALGALPFLFLRQLPRRAYDGVLGLGAGLMLAAATLGLLAEALRSVRNDGGALEIGRLFMVAGGFVTGALIAATMDRLIPHRHARGHRGHLGHRVERHRPHDEDEDLNKELGRPYVFVGAVSIHRLPEGLAIGAGFAAVAPRLGWMLSIAVGLQNVCEGIVMSAPMRNAGLSRLRTLLVVTLTGLTIPVGAAVGNLLSAAALAALPFVLALAGGTLIYVTSNEIIPESHSHGHEGTASAGLMAGFFVTLVIDALVH
jgi:zinc transporter, ZIP family